MRDSSDLSTGEFPSARKRASRTDLLAGIDGYRLALVGVVAVGFALRIWQLGEAPLWVDESFTTWAARNFLQGNGFSDPVGPASPYRRGWLTTTLPISASFALLGTTEFAARLPSVLIGSFSIVVVYLVGSQFDRQVGLIAAILAALDPFMIVWAREARMYAHLQLLYVLAIYLLYRWRRDHELRFRSRYVPALGVVALLGLGTHKAFLAFGLVALTFAATVMVRNGYTARTAPFSNAGRKALVLRSAMLFGGGIALAVVYVALSGVPSVLSGAAPEQWPTRGYLYYWEFFTETYPILWVLGVAGLVYLVLGEDYDELIAVGFVVPFLIASVTAQKAPRYVYHLLPLFYCVAVVPAVHFSRLVLRSAVAHLGSNDLVETTRVSVALVIVFVLIATPPIATLAVVQQDSASPFHPERSDFDEAAEFVDAHGGGPAIVMSTRPELSMWHLNETDYFFRQNGIKFAERRGGDLIHRRTDTEFVTDRAVLEEAMAEGRPIWLFAGKKFNQGFTSPEMRTFVTERFVAIGNESWENMVLYYWSPYIHQQTFSDPEDVWETAGNAFVYTDGGKEFLAVGRTVDTPARYGTQGDALNGTATMRVPIRADQPVTVATRTFGSKGGDRYVNVSVSTDGEDWRLLTRNVDDGWTTNRTVVPTAFADSNDLYVRVEGGSEGQNRYGGLVDYVHVYSLVEWEREYVRPDGSTTGETAENGTSDSSPGALSVRP